MENESSTFMSGIKSKKKVIFLTAGITSAVLVVLGISIVIIAAIASGGSKAEQKRKEEEHSIAVKKSMVKSNDWWADAFTTIGDIFMWLWIIMLSLFVIRLIAYGVFKYLIGDVGLYNKISDWGVNARGFVADKLSMTVKKGVKKLRKQPPASSSPSSLDYPEN